MSHGSPNVRSSFIRRIAGGDGRGEVGEGDKALDRVPSGEHATSGWDRLHASCRTTSLSPSADVLSYSGLMTPNIVSTL